MAMFKSACFNPLRAPLAIWPDYQCTNGNNSRRASIPYGLHWPFCRAQREPYRGVGLASIPYGLHWPFCPHLPLGCTL